MTCSSNTTFRPEVRRRTAAVAALLLLALPWQASGAVGDLRRYRVQAAAEMAAGHMDRAGAALDRALAIAPLDAGLWVDVARFRYRGGEHLLAIDAAERALSLGPDDPSALALKAELVRDREGMEPALAWYRKAVARAPRDLAIKADYAATLGEAGRAREMLAVTREILDRDPKNARAFYLQAVLAARAGDLALARRLLDRAGDRLGALPGALLLRGVVEIDAQNYALAISSLETLARRQPANRRVRDLLARALFLSGDYAGLVDRFGERALDDDASPYLTMTVARAFEQLDRRDRAAPLLDRLAHRSRDAVVVLSGQEPVGRMLSGGDAGGARLLVSGWLARNPGNYDHLALAGDIAMAAGSAREAAAFYARAAQVRSPDSLTMRRIRALQQAGEGIEAARLARGWLAADPASPAAIKANAWLAAGSANWEAARHLYEVLVASGGGRDVQLLADLALVQIKTGDTVTGLATARRAQALYRAEPVTAQALAVALVAAGEQPRSASALLAKARALLGDNPLLVETRTVLAAQRPAG